MRLFAWNESGKWMVINDQLQRVFVTDDEQLAKLLAAAPRMLQACSSAHKYLSLKYSDEDKKLSVLKSLNDAMKKAR